MSDAVGLCGYTRAEPSARGILGPFSSSSSSSSDDASCDGIFRLAATCLAASLKNILAIDSVNGSSCVCEVDVDPSPTFSPFSSFPPRATSACFSRARRALSNSIISRNDSEGVSSCVVPYVSYTSMRFLVGERDEGRGGSGLTSVMSGSGVLRSSLS